jgi:hypothetical protein
LTLIWAPALDFVAKSCSNAGRKTIPDGALPIRLPGNVRQ